MPSAVMRSPKAISARCAFGLDFGNHRMRAGSVATVDDNPDALMGEHPGYLGADAGGAARHQRALVFQL